MARVLGMDMYTLLYLKWITNKDLPYSTGDSAQCHVAAWMGGGSWGRRDTCICMAKSFCWPPETITTLFIGYTPKQNKKFFKKEINVRHLKHCSLGVLTPVEPGLSSLIESDTLWMIKSDNKMLLPISSFKYVSVCAERTQNFNGSYLWMSEFFFFKFCSTLVLYHLQIEKTIKIFLFCKLKIWFNHDPLLIPSENRYVLL